MTTKPEIKIVQYFWEGRKRSDQLNREINEAYCLRNGYEYVAKTFIPRDDRAIRWSKIPAMREELHDCDFLLFLDADVFFFSHDLKVEEELIPQLADKQIMMCADDQHRPHTEIIFVRNSLRTVEMLRLWDESSECPSMKEWCFNMPCEQEACVRTMMKDYADDVQLLEEYYLSKSSCGMCVRHMMGMKDEERYKTQKTFLASREGMLAVFCEMALNTMLT
jgi:hypothetical protein